jgi:peptide/nickel transport system substrate-binding protein
MIRRVLKAAAVALLAAIWAHGGPLAQPRDTLTVAHPVEPPHLDPTTHVAGSIREVVYANVFEGLTLIDRDGNPYPALAESWTIAPDGLAYTFRLRRNVKFHDGTDFDSAIVRFTLDRARGPNSVNANKRFFEPIHAIETPDSHTVVVRLSRPVGSFLYDMGSADAAMVAPASAEENRNRPIGTGPFLFRQWVRGDRVELARNPNHWGGAPRLASVTFRFMSDAQAQVAALRTGAVDVVPNLGAPELLAQFRADRNFQVVVGLTEGEVILAMNHRRPPFNDVRVRRAIAHALDRQAINEGAVAGNGRLIGTHYPPHYPDYVDLTQQSRYDVAQARALLREAGHANGFQARLILPPFPYARRAGEIIQAMLAEVGIRTNILVYQGPQWLSDVFRNFDYEFTVIAHTEPYDFPNYARPDWYIGYGNEAYRQVIAQWFAATDPQARTRLAQQAQRMLAEDAVVGFLFQLPQVAVMRRGVNGWWQNRPVQANDVTRVFWQE